MYLQIILFVILISNISGSKFPPRAEQLDEKKDAAHLTSTERNSNISVSKLPARSEQLNEKNDTNHLTSTEPSPSIVSRAGRQYLWPEGGCRNNPWHQQMDAFLLAYYVAHEHGKPENRGIVDGVFGAIFGTPKPQVIYQQSPHPPPPPPVYVDPYGVGSHPQIPMGYNPPVIYGR